MKNSAPGVLSRVPVGTRDVLRTLMRLPAGVALNRLVLIWVGALLLLEMAPATPFVALFGGSERAGSWINLSGLL